MAAFSLNRLIAAPHKSPLFWWLVVFAAVIIAAFDSLVGRCMPRNTLDLQLTAAASMFVLWVPCVWAGLRIGKVAWFLGALMLLTVLFFGSLLAVRT
ncbi:MAG: hypothetical protein ACJ8KU_11000 [Chthoniobacterales bacterium]